MTARFQLVYDPFEPSFCVSACLRPLLEPWFDLVPYNPDHTYHAQTIPSQLIRASAVVTVYQTAEGPGPTWYHELEQQGCRIIVDHLLDSDIDSASTQLHNQLTLRNGRWMWYWAALRWAQAGYQRPPPQRHRDRDFLLMMNKQRDHRDQILHDLQPLLAGALWSYIERGHDIEEVDQRTGSSSLHWYDFYHPSWYGRTAFSVISESWMRSDAYFANPDPPAPNKALNLRPNFRTEVSEKIFKPLAFSHPFLVYGSEGTLRYLHSLGFETWDNLWDERYDTQTQDQARLQAVTQAVHYAVKWLPHLMSQPDHAWDLRTEQKIQHNRARFWDLDFVSQQVTKEVIGDILEFVS